MSPKVRTVIFAVVALVVALFVARAFICESNSVGGCGPGLDCPGTSFPQEPATQQSPSPEK